LKKTAVFFGIILFSFTCVYSQEENLLDTGIDDIDSLFDEKQPETKSESQSNARQETKPDLSGAKSAAASINVRQTGLTVGASYKFQGGIVPGWEIPPWELNGEDEVKEYFNWGQGINMTADLSFDAQITEFFRARSVISFSIPGFGFSLGDFYFDYNFFNFVFLRAGKYEHSWGISRNFTFSNLLTRVPDGDVVGASFVIKADVPVGIGGLQLLALTRADITGGETPSVSQIGFGGKYNLALRWADFDMGIFYQQLMATRGIFSVKTTLLDIELYNEWLLAVDTHLDNKASFAVNAGAVKSFFGNKLEMNAEFFYNGEGNAFFFRPETDYREEDTVLFAEGINLAFNIFYRISGRSGLRLFTNFLYKPADHSVQLVPGFRMSPFQSINVYFAVPMALGSKEGYYYSNTADAMNRPFSITMLITLNGGVMGRIGN